MAITASLLSLVSGLVYNIAITRKIPTAGLGLLSLLNAALAFSLLPTALTGFVFPRVTARDGALNITAAIAVSLMLYLATAVLTVAYLASVWGKMGTYAWLVLSVALASEVVYYVQSITNSILMVKNRGAFITASITQSITKLLVIPVIMFLGWSIPAVLWSSVFITVVPTVYALVRSLGFHARLRGAVAYLRDLVNASWVPLMGYAINSFRSLDAMFIGLLGYGQLGIWYVLFILSKPFSFSSTLVSVTYGELLERDRWGIVYRDLLLVLVTSTYTAITLTVFAPVFLNLVRPSMEGSFNLLITPVALAMVSNVMGNANQFLSNVMQGIDKRDILEESIRARSYLGSLVLYAHLAELVFTVVYLTTMVPLILVLRGLSIPYYAINGALISSLMANTAAIAFRLNRLGSSRSLFKGRDLVIDYVAPTGIALAVLLSVSRLLSIHLIPSIWVSLVQVVEVSLMSAVVYIAALAVSRNNRGLIKYVLRRVIEGLITR